MNLLIGLTILYGIISSITTFDIRLNQAKKTSTFPSEELDISLPNWVASLYWIEWVIFIIIAFLNWKYALLVFIIKFLLKIIPVLEIIGNILMSPFKSKRN
jgi:hypothetical protein